ncbi:predicted protein [Uncinocarpus reesii 1704]|uniref:Uncharacterized protein n=1 Tax=Uncinocarpus reesii (strain UAMH 1704) TaxID=336963 RepID=C4JWG6_UNCRE|nr:uncharacterized protein UREG_06908 [Uncinocarpus reesii 1704]EEP82043.1 predicted protein [Uncinocarpus reesii 1704]
MVIYVDYARDAYASFPPQSSKDAQRLLSVEAVALNSSAGTSIPVALSADHVDESGTEGVDAEAGDSSSAGGLDPVSSKFALALSCYPSYLGGGLGAGIGDTCQGVQCGREDKCLAAEEIEVEVDCEVDDWVAEHADHSLPHHGDGHHADGEGPGYLRQEIMGVGGVVKHKVKKRVKIGASVEEREDERESSVYLQKEASGEARSWCGWCFRVVPSKSELN